MEDRVRFIVQSGDPLLHDGPNVVRDLGRSPRRISSVYVYDRRGMAFFERQCRTPEYYLRRAESALLRSHAADVVACCGPVPVVELGAGTAQKTRWILAQYAEQHLRCDYYPIDVDTDTLSESARRLVGEFPRLYVHALGTTYEAGLRALPDMGGRLVLFLGSSIGNMEWDAIDDFLLTLARQSRSGDHVLIGADLHKDAMLIERAYNDAAGWGARSTLNMLHHLNHRYDGDFNVGCYRYRSQYDVSARKNVVFIDSLVDQTVTLATLNFRVGLRAGESIDAEVMWKFDVDELTERMQRAGFALVKRWIERRYQYALLLLRRC